MSYTALRQTLVDSLRTTQQIEEDDIATILPLEEEKFNESEFKAKFLELDRERIASINQRGSDKFQQGYNKGKKEERGAFEKEIREEFGIDDNELIGTDLVNKVVELNTAKSKADPSKLSEDELKAHPSVIKLLNDKDKTFQTREQELKAEFETKLTGFQKENRFGKVSKKALSILDTLNPVLSKDPVRAANQRSILLNDLQENEYQEEGDGFIPLDKDGKRLENSHGKGITFEELVKSKSEKYFDFKQAEDRDTPPAGGDDSGARTSPKTEAEYAKIISDPSIPLEERKQIRENWQKAKS